MAEHGVQFQVPKLWLFPAQPPGPALGGSLLHGAARTLWFAGGVVSQAAAWMMTSHAATRPSPYAKTDFLGGYFF